MITCERKKVNTLGFLGSPLGLLYVGPSSNLPFFVQKQYVQTLFDGIAHRYDFLNHLLSAGCDLYWRRRAISHLAGIRPRKILDVATGTADLAIAALRLDPESVVGVDISENMLERGREKIARAGLADRISLRVGDAETLEFPPASFDAVTVAFGVRNFENLEKGLQGMYRALRTGGKAVILEFSRPRTPPLKQVYLFYFRHLLPRIGRAVSAHNKAYSYLPDTVMRFPQGTEFLDILSKVGFTSVDEERLTGGIVTIYTGIK